MGKAKGKDRKVKRVELKDPEMGEFLNRVEGRASSTGWRAEPSWTKTTSSSRGWSKPSGA